MITLLLNSNKAETEKAALDGSLGISTLYAARSIVGGPVCIGILAGLVMSILIQHAIAKGASHLVAIDWTALWEKILRVFRSGTDAGGMLVLKPA